MAGSAVSYGATRHGVASPFITRVNHLSMMKASEYRCSVCSEPKPLMHGKCLGCLMSQALGSQAVILDSPFTKKGTVVSLYRITIEHAEINETGQVTEWKSEIQITVSTQYLLTVDIPEWLREEIDPNAEVKTFDYQEAEGYCTIDRPHIAMECNGQHVSMDDA